MREDFFSNKVKYKYKKYENRTFKNSIEIEESVSRISLPPLRFYHFLRSRNTLSISREIVNPKRKEEKRKEKKRKKKKGRKAGEKKRASILNRENLKGTRFLRYFIRGKKKH